MFRCTLGPLVQVLSCADLEEEATLEWYKRHMPERVDAVYSDPPWSPGNATYWRTHANLARCESYGRFCHAWAWVAALACSRGASDVLVEQSARKEWRDPLMDAIVEHTTFPPFRRLYDVRYSGGPNVLLHYGRRPLSTDPTGMAGEPMTIRACSGLALRPGACLVEPCLGKGMTSRMAHYFGWSLIGTELNPKRLAVTVAWLRRQGYTVEET